MKDTKRKLSIFTLFLSGLTLFFITASAYLLYLYKDNQIAAQNNSDTLDEVTSTIDVEDSNFPGIKIITEISNDITIPFAIQYPESTYTEFNDDVKKYIKEIKQKHLTNVANYKKTNTTFTNELNISFETFEHPNKLYSFVVVTNKYIGNLDGEIDIQTFHLNNETKESPSLKNILNHDIENLKALATIAQVHIEKNDGTLNSITTESIEHYTKPSWENYQHFAFTDEALILYFSHNQADGSLPIVSLPYDQINDLLIESYQVETEESLLDENQPIHPNESADELLEETNNKNDVTDETASNEEELPEKRVALTFDDGPDPDVTTRILETLKKYDAKATFYMLGSRVEYYPEIAQMVQEAGHEIANHSWTHPDLTKASSEKIFNEIDRTSKIIEDVTGVKPNSFRPPYGAFNDLVKQQTDLPITLWDVDTLDWKHRNPQQLLAYVQNGVRDGSIVLMHDIHASTADGLDAVMEYLQTNGYSFVTVSEIEQAQ